MYQYPASEYEDQMMSVLRRAQANNPQAGFRLKWVDPEEKHDGQLMVRKNELLDACNNNKNNKQ